MFATALHFHINPSLIFAGKAGAYQNGADHEAPLIALSENIRLSMEVNGCGKHSSLLRNNNSYCYNKFYSTGACDIKLTIAVIAAIS